MSLPWYGELPERWVNIKDPEHHAKSDYWKEAHDWHATSIKTILDNPTYLGHNVSGRRTTRSFKDKKIIKQPEESWIVTENTHEAIIDQRSWDLAHEKLQSRKRADNHGAVQIFAGLAKCADCGYAMSFTKNGASWHYQCSQYNVKGKAYCSSHYIRYEELYNVVLHDIQRRAKAAAKMDEHMLVTLRQEASGQLGKSKDRLRKNLRLLIPELLSSILSSVSFMKIVLSTA